ncbi:MULTISPECIES: MarR family winged helix-turn-helix transcriptional regulator [unclassified Caballeronia]|jgi:DNA-binding MarR family transcriptional regulator|uniref:MarR family winged helix-turn-helix transcriptional regulator n=1 Tax=unclassified Caballeronia TaxID=2646786 RepID=UPI001FD27CEB|nr:MULTISPECIES: MarR family winged helix-turn-helix transcriptional regulator [unclassified Caballeronia]
MATKMAAKNVNRGRPGCSCTALRKATRRISQLYDAAISPSGLKITQRAVLAQIGRSEPTNVGKLAAALVMDSGALAHTLKPLERDGFISLEVNPDDRRHKSIGLTPEGREKLAESDVLWRKAQAIFDSSLGRAEAEALRGVLDKLLSDEFAERFEKDMQR